MYVQSFPGMMEPNNSKLNYMINMWKAAQTDLDHLVSNFTAALEKGQKDRNETGLNNLIVKLKEIVQADTGKNGNRNKIEDFINPIYGSKLSNAIVLS